MADSPLGSGAAPGESGAQGGEGQDKGAATGSTDAGSGTKSPSPDDHERALKDMHRFKAESQKRAQEIETLQKKLEETQKKELREREQYKQLYEDEAKKASELEAKNRRNSEAFLRTVKLDSIRAAAAKHQIRPEALDDLELYAWSDVEAEITDSGIRANGAEQAILQFKKARPHLFLGATAPRVNTGGNGSAQPPGELNWAEINKLEHKDPAKWRELVTQKMTRDRTTRKA